jgi:hypothetical protein
MFSCVSGFALHIAALHFRFPVSSSSPPDVIDLLDDGSPHYGRPLVTVGAIPFGVTTPGILRQFEVSIASWIRSSAQIVVHLYDVVGGMGPLAGDLLSSVQREFGRGRVMICGTIVKKMRIETLPETFEAIERDTSTVFAAWFSNDMILPPNWMDYVYAARRYFGEYTNYSMHFARRDLFVCCRDNISLRDIIAPDWPAFFAGFRSRCRSRLHTLGYDCYLWNYIGINMTRAQVEPFFVGRPDFDGAIIAKQMQQGWFVTAYPEVETYHLEHPERIQYTKRKKHPDSLYNRNLLFAINGRGWRNEEIDIRIGLNGISERRNGTWSHWTLNRPRGTFPLGYPPDRILEK